MRKVRFGAFRLLVLNLKLLWSILSRYMAGEMAASGGTSAPILKLGVLNQFYLAFLPILQ